MEEEKVQTHIPENQRVIDFLYRCMAVASTTYKKHAYRRAISEIYSYWSVIETPDKWTPQYIGPSIARKIREFLEGFPEEDIIDN
jgi:DNA polymerase/3'-5' exonuclease PolX